MRWARGVGAGIDLEDHLVREILVLPLDDGLDERVEIF
jgi:hypothetical protein